MDLKKDHLLRRKGHGMQIAHLPAQGEFMGTGMQPKIVELKQGAYQLCPAGGYIDTTQCRPDSSMNKVVDERDLVTIDDPSRNKPAASDVNDPKLANIILSAYKAGHTVTVIEFISSPRFASFGSPMDRLAAVKLFAKEHHVKVVDSQLEKDTSVLQGIWDHPEKIAPCQEIITNNLKNIDFAEHRMGVTLLPYQTVQMISYAQEDARECVRKQGIEDRLAGSALDVYNGIPPPLMAMGGIQAGLSYALSLLGF